MRTFASLVLSLCAGAAAATLGACQAEKRELGPALPQTPPAAANDPRADLYEHNKYQVSQGGLLYDSLGCQNCHGEGASFAEGRWRYGGGADQVYASIADGRPGMPKYAAAGAEQVWQLTAYVRSLKAVSPPMRRRESLDLAGEPAGPSWSGPVR